MSADPSVPDQRGAPRQLERNIAAIMRLEQSALEREPLGDRLASAIGSFIGSIKFVILQASLFVAWLVVNRPGSPLRFDPFPHTWLMLVLGVETIVLSTFVLINQRQMQKIADRRAQLSLQINLLAESEMTKLLNAFETIAEHLGVPGMEDDQELRDLAVRTEVEQVVQLLDEQLAGTPGPGTADDPDAPEPGASE